MKKKKRDRVRSPSQEQIRKRAAEIRKGWSEKDRRKRLVDDTANPTPWRVPEIAVTPEIAEELDDDSD